MNKVFLMGNLVKDPESSLTSKGVEQTRIVVACNDLYSRETSFLSCTGWNKTAVFVNTYLKKGDTVVVDGRLLRRSYVDRNNQTIYVHDILIDNIKGANIRASSHATETKSKLEPTNVVELDTVFGSTDFMKSEPAAVADLPYATSNFEHPPAASTSATGEDTETGDEESVPEWLLK